MAQHFFSDTAVATTLTSSMTNSQTTMAVASVSGQPASFPYYMAVDLEVVRVTSRASNTLTVVRGVSSTTAVTHSSGAAVTHVVAAEHFNDVSAATGAWTSFTPTLTQSATVTKTTNHAKYIVLGKWMSVVVDMTVTGAGTANNAIVIGLPVAIPLTQYAIGSGFVYDSSAAGFYTGVAVVNTTTTINIMPGQGLLGLLGATNGQMTAALATGDRVCYQVTCEIT